MAVSLGTTFWEWVLGSLPPDHHIAVTSRLKPLLWLSPVYRTKSRPLGKAHKSSIIWPWAASSPGSLFTLSPALCPRKLTCIKYVNRFCVLCLLGQLTVAWRVGRRRSHSVFSLCLGLLSFKVWRRPHSSLPEVQISWVLSCSCSSHWALVIFPSIRCHNDFLVLVPGERHHPFCVPLTLATPLWTISSSHSLYPLLITSLSCWDRLIQTFILFSSVISY